MRKLLIVFLALGALGCNFAVFLTPTPGVQEVRTGELGKVPTETPSPNFMTVCNIQAELGLNMRDGVGTSARVLEVLPNGTVVRVLGEEQLQGGGKWFEVDANGKTGWVNARYLCQI